MLPTTRRAWLFALTLFSCLISCKSTVFGFKTRDGTADTNRDVTMTLYDNGSRYHCNVYPTKISTLYLCNSSDVPLQCLTNFSYPLALQIDFLHDDSLKFDLVQIGNFTMNHKQ